MRRCEDISEVRQEIDKIDSELISLIAMRGSYVQQAAKFKKTTEDIEAPDRVVEVICKARTRAAEIGANIKVIEITFRAMISAFIEAEKVDHNRLKHSDDR